MFIELSFPSTNFQDYLNFRRANDQLLDKNIYGANIPKPKPKGGKICIVDWNSKEIIWEIDAPTPAGFIMDKNEFKVCDELGDQVISINSRKKVKSFFSHPLFNYPHDIDKIGERFLVTSTGLDAILEFNSQGKLLFQWHAVMWGYDKTPLGNKRIINFSKDHRGMRYSTLDRTCHINSAIYYDSLGDKILTTFFHKGELVLIDKKNSSLQVIYKGLDHPHAIHKGIDGNFIFSETGLNKIHVLDEKLKPLKSFENVHNCEWIQDSIFTSKGTILIGDANKARILEVTYPDFILIDEYFYHHNWKLFKVNWDNEEKVSLFLNGLE